MNSEPDFELLTRPAIGPLERAALFGSALLAATALASACYLWVEQRAVARELVRVATSRIPSVAAAPGVDPRFAEAAWKASQLLQAPVDSWLRELEHCQPEQARTRDLRVDVAAQRVTAVVEIKGDVVVAAWLQCFNAGLALPAWRVARVDATSDVAPAGSPMWQPSWSVVLERQGK